MSGISLIDFIDLCVVSAMLGGALRLLGVSWGVKTAYLEAPGVSLGGSGVSIGGVRSLRVVSKLFIFTPKIGEMIQFD